MRYVIIGAGAVGGTIGARLHQHGHRVTLVARGAQLVALRKTGLRLITPDGDYQLDVPVVETPAEAALTPECRLVLAVKSQDTVAALEQWATAPVRGGGTAGEHLPLLCAQNGVANEPAALRWFARVYGVCAWLPATYLTPGEVVAEGAPCSGLLQIGRYPGGVDEPSEQAAADLAASGFVASAEPDVMRWKYGKLLANLANGVEALFAGADRDLVAEVRAEGEAVLAAAGIAHAPPAEAAARRADRVQIRSVAGRQRGGSSTWQSLVRGAGSAEVDYLNGEIVRLGRQWAVATPVNLAVQRAVQRVVRAGGAPGEFPIEEFWALAGR